MRSTSMHNADIAFRPLLIEQANCLLSASKPFPNGALNPVHEGRSREPGKKVSQMFLPNCTSCVLRSRMKWQRSNLPVTEYTYFFANSDDIPLSNLSHCVARAVVDDESGSRYFLSNQNWIRCTDHPNACPDAGGTSDFEFDPRGKSVMMSLFLGRNKEKGCENCDGHWWTGDRPGERVTSANDLSRSLKAPMQTPK